MNTINSNNEDSTVLRQDADTENFLSYRETYWLHSTPTCIPRAILDCLQEVRDAQPKETRGE